MAQTQAKSNARTASRRKTQRKRTEPRPSEYAKEALSEWTKAARLGAAAVAPESIAPTASATNKREPTERPSEHAKDAISEWSKALRYGAAAIAPAAKRARERTKETVARKTESANEQSLLDRLNPAKTDKGGRIGDAADALLARMGTPGKLASKASLGSRVVDKVLPSFDGDADKQDEEEPEAEAIEPEPEAEPIPPEPEAAATGAEPEADDRKPPEPDASSEEDQDEDAPEPTAEENGRGKPAKSERAEVVFAYERDYAKRHDRRPPNAYPAITD